MSKRKSRSINNTNNTSSRQKIRSSQGVLRMTVHHRNEESRETCFPPVSSSIKNDWPVKDNDSSSWDRNSRATSSSWPSEMEELATKKVLQCWYTTEKHIYSETDEISTGPWTEECDQWKSHIIHLRLIGKSVYSLSNEGSSENIRIENLTSGITDDRYTEEIFMEDNLGHPEDMIEESSKRRLIDDQKTVLDQMCEYVCTELTKINDKIEDSLSKDLDEVLRITPAPSYIGKRWRDDRKKLENGDCSKMSAQENHSCFEKNVNPTDIVTQVQDQLTSDVRRRDGTDMPRVARNKLGTVFNEKIVVSPVPFVVSTRESFTTLRMTPISFRAHNFKISSPEGMGRHMSSASTTNSGHRIAPTRISQIHSAWQAPVCPTVWPKNIKLAPIDPARLPSSKNRSSIDSMAALPHRNRNSLSPLLRPIKPVTSAHERHRVSEGLEIQGKQIVTRSAKKILSKISCDCSPRACKNARNKARATKNIRQ